MKRGFDFCCNHFVWEMFDLRILFSHIPSLEAGFDLNIHGHLHSGRHREISTDERHHLISLEETGYQPQLLETVITKWQRAMRRRRTGS